MWVAGPSIQHTKAVEPVHEVDAVDLVRTFGMEQGLLYPCTATHSMDSCLLMGLGGRGVAQG